MSDQTDFRDSAPEPSAPVTPPAAPSGPTPGEAWGEVVARMNELGDAVAQWAKSAANEPDTKQKLDEVRSGISEIGQKADAALGRAVRSDLGKQVQEGAEQAGQAISDAAQHVTRATAPHMKNAFTGLADAFSKAAAMVDEAAHRHPETTPHAEVTPHAEDAPAAPPIPSDENPPSPKDE